MLGPLATYNNYAKALVTTFELILFPVIEWFFQVLLLLLSFGEGKNNSVSGLRINK